VALGNMSVVSPRGRVCGAVRKVVRTPWILPRSAASGESVRLAAPAVPRKRRRDAMRVGIAAQPCRETRRCWNQGSTCFAPPYRIGDVERIGSSLASARLR